MDLTEYRRTDREQNRLGQLIQLVPANAESVMDIGARDGYFAELLAKRGHSVTALDLEPPQVGDARVRCVQGDVTALRFEADSFDVLVCAEVLEHLPPHTLKSASRELQRVARTYLLIGVPFAQDLRFCRSTCYTCGSINPPWSHVNTFTEQSLRALFPDMEVESVTFVGQHRDYTNALSVLLLDWAGNPYGTYVQEELCVQCSSRLKPPPPRTLLQRLFTKAAVLLNRAQSSAMPPKPAWMHVLFRKPTAACAVKRTSGDASIRQPRKRLQMGT